MSHLDEYGTYLAALVAGVVALGWIIRKMRRAVRALDAIERVVARELTHNHGTSMKDDVHGVARTLGLIARRVDALEQRVTELDNHICHPAETP